MTMFEENGIQKQYGAKTKSMAKKAFEQSCAICGIKGKQISCARCAIASAYHDVITFVLK